MKLIALGLAAATAVATVLSAAPASAGGVYFGIDDGYSHYRRPPPPPVYYRPRPYYYEARPAYYDDGYDRRVRAYERPERFCETRVRRSWGPYGPVTKRIETCSDD